MDHFNAVILAGGSGTRLWPLSTASFPKQFLPLPNGRSLIQEALARIETLHAPERTWVVTGRVMAELVHEHVPSVPVQHILGEPVGRNTSAAVGWAAASIARQDPQAVMAGVCCLPVVYQGGCIQQGLPVGRKVGGKGGFLEPGVQTYCPLDR